MKKLKKIIDLVSYGLMGILFLFIVYVVILNVSNKEISIFGRKMFVVQTGSMEPTIEVGTVIIIKEGEYENLDNGTVITFDFDEGYGIPNTHRIVGYYYEYIDENGKKQYASNFDYDTVDSFLEDNPNCNVVGYRTKGDNNNVYDIDPVLFDSIHGVYVRKMVVVTFIYGLLSTFGGFLMLIMIPLLLLLISQVITLYKTRQEIKTEKEIEELEKQKKELEEKIKEKAIKEYIEQNKD